MYKKTTVHKKQKFMIKLENIWNANTILSLKIKWIYLNPILFVDKILNKTTIIIILESLDFILFNQNLNLKTL